MKTITQSSQIQITASIPEIRKINEHLFKPLKAGFFINLLSYVIGTNEKFGMDVLDLLLAGVGFFLQLTGTLLKSFVR